MENDKLNMIFGWRKFEFLKCDSECGERFVYSSFTVEESTISRIHKEKLTHLQAHRANPNTKIPRMRVIQPLQDDSFSNFPRKHK